MTSFSKHAGYDSTLLADIEITFEKIEKQLLHFIEITHLAKESSNTVDKCSSKLKCPNSK
jgi:hypothetical protein